MAYKEKQAILSVPLSQEKMNDLVVLTKELEYKSKTKLSKDLLEEAIDAKKRQVLQNTSK